MASYKGKQLKEHIALDNLDKDDSDSSQMEPRYNEHSIELTDKTSSSKRVKRRRRSSAVPKRTPSVLYSPMRKQEKKDRLSSFQQWDSFWKSSSFLQANDINSKEGRKLRLNNKKYWEPFQIVKKQPVYVENLYQPPHTKRRDDIRFLTRMKLLK